MGDSPGGPSERVQKLIDSFSSTYAKNDSAATRFTKLDLMVRLALDQSKPRRPMETSDVVDHIRSKLKPAPLYGMTKVAAAFDLAFTDSGRVVALRTKNGEVYQLAEDGAGSSRSAIEFAVVKLVQEYDKDAYALPSFTESSRSSGINLLKPYGSSVLDHYREYRTRLLTPDEPDTVIRLKPDEVVNGKDGSVNAGLFQHGGAYAIQNVEQSRLRDVVNTCKEKNCSLRLEIDKEYVAAHVLNYFKEFEKISAGSGSSVLYMPKTHSKTSPLVPGYEDKDTVNRVIGQIRKWLSCGKAVYRQDVYRDSTNPNKRHSFKGPSFVNLNSAEPGAYKMTQPPDTIVSDLVAIIKEGGGRQVLQNRGYHKRRHGVAQYHADAVSRMIQNLSQPTAIKMLKTAHCVLSSKDMHPKTAEFLPKDAWKSALYLLTVDLDRYNLEGAVATGGDYVPRTPENTPRAPRRRTLPPSGRPKFGVTSEMPGPDIGPEDGPNLEALEKAKQLLGHKAKGTAWRGPKGKNSAIWWRKDD